MLASLSVDTLTIAIAVVGFLLGLIGTLVGIIFNDLRKQVRENTKHVEGVMATVGPLMWRTITMEDWLEDRFDYKVPRDIGWVEKRP